jgi:23S rRNA pseudouridine2604 synthase
MTHAPHTRSADAAGERLSKRVMQLRACSRSEAEQYIEGGWVRVDGVVVQTPAFRVATQRVEVDTEARLQSLTPVTLLVHKPAAWLDGTQDPAPDRPQAHTPPSARSRLRADSRWARDNPDKPVHKAHFARQEVLVPLEDAASGLQVFTQDWRVKRKLVEDLGTMEHELMAEVQGAVTAEMLEPIQRALRDTRNRLPDVRASLNHGDAQRSTLRFAVKGAHPGLVAYLCDCAGLQIQALRRIRLGRVGLRELPVGQWRYLGSHERF